MNRSTAALVVAAVVVTWGVTACQSNPDNGDARARANRSAEWQREDLTRADAIVKTVRAATGGCLDARPYPRGTFLETFEKLRWPYPLAVEGCTVAGEDVQIEVYETERAMERRLETRLTRLCEQAGFTGFPFVRGNDFLLLPDTLAAARDLAPVVDGTAGAKTCDT
jgi:hypothetical protein